MSKPLVEHWEVFDKPYKIFEDDGLSTDDLSVKSRFSFVGGKYTFTGKHKFNFGEKNKAAHDYTLRHKCPRAQIDFKHKGAGETVLEGHAHCLKKDDITFDTWFKFLLDQGENRVKQNVDVMFRFLHKNNNLLSVGIEDWNPSSGSPEAFSVYSSHGHIHDGAHLTFNTFFNFNFKNKFLPHARFMFKAKKGDVDGYIRANVNRTQVDTKGTTEETKEADAAKTTVNQAVDLVAKFNKSFEGGKKLGGIFNYDLDSKKADVSIIGSHDRGNVKLKGKLGSDRTLTVGIQSIHDDITIGCVAKSTLNSKTEKVGEADVTKHWCTYKLGAHVEFQRV